MRRPQVTVITAAHPPAYRFLPAAARSLAAQYTPLRWLVVADDNDTSGVTRALTGALGGLGRRTEFDATGQSAGAAAARTLALAHVETEWLVVLDADDQWAPQGIDTLLAACRRNDAAWATGHSDDLDAEGNVVPFAPLPENLAGKTFSPGELLELCADDFLPWVQCALVARTDAVREVGGWPAFPRAEDSGLTLALAATTRGHISGSTVYRYRKWPGQTTAHVPLDDIRRWHRIGARRAARLPRPD